MQWGILRSPHVCMYVCMYVCIQNVEIVDRTVTFRSMGDEWSLPSTCQTPTRPVGTKSSAGEGRSQGQREVQARQGQRIWREDLVVNLILLNRGNHCYTNALVKCLALLAIQTSTLEQLPPQLSALLKSFLAAKRALHIWDNPFWRALLKQWRDPHEQHDAAELLACLTESCPGMKGCFGLNWEARSNEGGEIRVRDEGCSLPLCIRPASAVLAGRTGTSIQAMIDDWAQQEDAHAAITSPQALIVQIGRFQQAGVDRAVSKWSYDVIPDRLLTLPVFSGEGLDTFGVNMTLSSILVHRGDVPNKGHYQAFLNIADQFMLADDNCSARPCDAVEYADMGPDSYLFFYMRA